MFGVINHRTAASLASLPSRDQLVYEAFMETSKLDETIDSYLRGNKRVQFKIVINIMGPESISQAVGQELSKQRLFLQRPYQLSEGTTYNNPQYLAIEDVFGDALEGCDIELQEVPTADPLGGQPSERDDLVDELWSIINNSSLPHGMTRIEVDQSIHTVLMEYVLKSFRVHGGYISECLSKLMSLLQTSTRCG